MNFLLTAIRALRFFPLATRRQAASQAVKYAKAVAYLQSRNIYAAKRDNEFKYHLSTRSVL